MNSVACTIFFIVGCFGQQNIVPPPPSLNSVTAALPTQNAVPGLPQQSNGTPNLPSPSGVSGLPQPPNVITNIPSLSNDTPPNGIPNLPLPSGMPGLPQPPNIITNIPSLPNGTPPNSIPSSPSGVTPAPEILERPCRVGDLGCIRRYFLQHGKCLPAPGRVPNPLYRAISNQFYPRVNITETTLNCEYRGFNNGRVQEFYINRDTDKLVIAIEMRDLQKSCNDTFFRYHRRAKEPVITHGYASVLFRSVVVTVTIPQVENLRLDKSDNFAYSNEALPTVVLDPRLGQSSDPTVPVAFAAFQADFPTDVTENFLTESSYMGATYIQYVICDFGLQLI